MAPLGRLDRKLDGSAEERLLLLPLPAQDGGEKGSGLRARVAVARRRGSAVAANCHGGLVRAARRTVQRRRRWQHRNCVSGGARKCGQGGGGAAATAAGMYCLGSFGGRLDGRAVARKREVDCTARVTVGLRLGLEVSHGSDSGNSQGQGWGYGKVEIEVEGEGEGEGRGARGKAEG